MGVYVGRQSNSNCNHRTLRGNTRLSFHPHPDRAINLGISKLHLETDALQVQAVESKVAFIRNSLKTRSSNSSVVTNPSTVKLFRTILLSRTCVPKFISTIYTGHSHPMSIALGKLDASWIYSKGTYKAGVSYVLAYQVYIY